MNKNKLLGLLILSAAVAYLPACSKKDSSTQNNNTIYVDNGDDAPTIDPAMSSDVTSARVIYDLFAGLVDFDQKNQPIPGLAKRWDVSPDGQTYTFYLRDGIKFSDGTPITADDVVFSWQRVSNPKTASPYNTLMSNVVNGQDIIDGKLKPDTLGIKAIDSKTVQVSLVNSDPSFLQICTMPNLFVVSKANLTKHGDKWTDPKNMVVSGAYKIKDWVIKGHMDLEKNSNYYDVNNVSIPNVVILPITDFNASLNQYSTGAIDVTNSMPVDQYKKINKEYPKDAHTVAMEALYFYDFNMSLPKYRDNLNLRKALTIAVDREALTKDVLGQQQTPSYSYVSKTIEQGSFSNLDYDWSVISRDQQIALAKDLFTKAGYGPDHPLEININYNTKDINKKIAIAIASMWQNTFGEKSIKVTQSNQEWKTFLKARRSGDFDIARDAWSADYDDVTTYITKFSCNSPMNYTKYCNKDAEALLQQAQQAPSPDQRINLINRAIDKAQKDYVIIPLYQETYFRLVKPRVQGYNIDNNHFDHVQSKWYKLQ
ncbi:MAG: peptide ABC transporter substrate-binding protein [Burkholderiales bacterium]|nr:peptide ABC transporter substrate-binding protein [Burkholderiales bacterium]